MTDPYPLSELGRQRQELILQDALRQARLRRRRRRTVQTAAMVVPMTAAALLVWTSLGPWQSQPSPVARKPAPAEPIRSAAVEPRPLAPATDRVLPPVHRSAAVTVRIVPMDPTVLDRTTAKTKPSYTILSDEELLARLEEVGQPSGLVHVGDRVILLPHKKQERVRNRF